MPRIGGDGGFGDQRAQRRERRLRRARTRPGVARRVAVDLGLVAVDPEDHVGVEADHRIAAARRAAFDRFQQEHVAGAPARQFQKGRDRRFEIGDEPGRRQGGRPPRNRRRKRRRRARTLRRSLFAVSAVAACSAFWLILTLIVFSSPPTYCSSRSLPQRRLQLLGDGLGLRRCRIEWRRRASHDEEDERPPSTVAEPAPPGGASKICTIVAGEDRAGGALHVGHMRICSPSSPAHRRSAGRRDLLDEFVGLGGQRLLLGLLAHRGFDRVLDLVEALLARRFDVGDLEPDIAAVARRHRLVVDADVGGESGLQQIGSAGKLGDGLAGLVASSVVDRLDVARLEPRGGGGFGERLAGGALILDRVMQAADFGRPCAWRPRPRSSGSACSNVLEDTAGSIFATRETTMPKALPRSRRSRARARRRRSRRPWRRRSRAASPARDRILWIELPFGGQRVEGRPALEPGHRVLGLVFGLEDELADLALFGRAIALGLHVLVKFATSSAGHGGLGERGRGRREHR